MSAAPRAIIQVYSLVLSLFLVAAVDESAVAAHGSSSQTWCKAEEEAALLDFRRSFASQPGEVFDSWILSRTCCAWRGIQCSSTKDDDDSRRFTALSDGYRVRVLSLPGLKLAGEIPPSIARLRALEAVDLSANQISGSIPAQLVSLAHLKLLDLSANNLSGALPPAFRQGFPAIVRLNLSDNLLEGPIPPMLSSASIESLDLSYNFFAGALPSPMICAPSLNVSNNELSGPVLAALAHCPSIQSINAAANMLNRSLAAAPEVDFFASPAARSIKLLDLSTNAIPGGIPAAIGRLAALEELFLGYNSLGGEIPSSISNISALRILSLRNNDLGGEMAALDFSRLPNLTELDLSYNRISGNIPSGISQCRHLTSLTLGKNELRGDIPSSLGALRKLETLSLSGNELGGGIPAELQECEALVMLVLSKNSFTEPLPDRNVTGFRNLQLLAIGNAGLSGSIPAWIGNCSKLQVLDLSWNRLVGEIPRWIGALDHLFYLDLSNNSFTGSIPPDILGIRCLIEDEDASSSAADDLRPVANTLFVKHRSNSSALQYNQVSAFPPSIILASNNLSGVIPLEFGKLRKLVSLDLSNNKLVGSIPACLANASDLESLDLSSNGLSGSIPPSLVKLTFLAAFNVSFNRLSGAIPSGNQFASFSNSSYIANSRLCGAPLSIQCPAAAMEATSSSSRGGGGDQRGPMNRGAIMGITISISLGLTALFAAMLMLSFSRARAGHRQDIAGRNFKEMSVAQMMDLTVTMFGQRYRRITVGDLIKATNNFDATNIIGCGGFGLVFKANLPDGNVVAIKRLTSEDGGPQMEKEFDAELSTLGNITHPNLVSLEGYCRLGMRDRLLVYSYMENGSLDYWLHERSDGGSRLTWRHRLAILRETARGLEYLHRGCNPHIVHRDIKSSNILLDGDLRAHVADFGLARLMLPSDTHVTTELVGTLGYIPPEYAQSSEASLRGDVYSFGVLVLEVLSRRRPVDACRRGGIRDLVPWVEGMQATGRGIEIVDPLLLQNYSEVDALEEMLRVLDVACYCVDSCPQRRPGIEEVVAWLDAVGSSRLKVGLGKP
ncbi:phytosulfokine receptor 2 [Selaginella moellendorffii]|nr:phytosulfokine receptor 2 [Selaginella moellendorffii]XP_024515512.1 phytosulfokine receptor 2 [Selaginella moellendorffii]|eukprot:XP_002985846.2 phytosulfokine receptor 2 [Selaginella moellendorffii]